MTDVARQKDRSDALVDTASPDLLGGDFYDLFPLDAGQWAFFIGGVCGKEPKAAAVTSLARYSMRAAALHDPDAVTVLTSLNTVLHERYHSGDTRYCTAILGVLETGERHVGVGRRKPGQSRVRTSAAAHSCPRTAQELVRTVLPPTRGGSTSCRARRRAGFGTRLRRKLRAYGSVRD